MKKFNLVLIAAAITFVFLGFVKTEKKPEVGLNIGNKAPELKYKNPDGKVISLSEVNKGRVVGFMVWSLPPRKPKCSEGLHEIQRSEVQGC